MTRAKFKMLALTAITIYRPDPLCHGLGFTVCGPYGRVIHMDEHVVPESSPEGQPAQKHPCRLSAGPHTMFSPARRMGMSAFPGHGGMRLYAGRLAQDAGVFRSDFPIARTSVGGLSHGKTRHHGRHGVTR